jgi:hypothetical protein
VMINNAFVDAVTPDAVPRIVSELA